MLPLADQRAARERRDRQRRQLQVPAYAASRLVAIEGRHLHVHGHDVEQLGMAAHLRQRCQAGMRREVSALDLGAADFIAEPLTAARGVARVRTQLRVKRMAGTLALTGSRVACLDGVTAIWPVARGPGLASTVDSRRQPRRPPDPAD